MLLAAVIAASPPPQQSEAPAASAVTWSCSPRRLCSQIATCAEAQWYLRQCPWGGRLDGDHDGIPCETLCGQSP